MPKRKIANNSTPMGAAPKKVIYEEYFNCLTLELTPTTESFVRRTATELLDWAQHDQEALKITIFFNKRGINPGQVDKWRKKYPYFNDAYEIALSIIGDRRELGGLSKKLDSGMVSYTMAHYDKAWKDLAEWRVKMKSEAESANSGPSVVVIEKIEPSAAVPLKKEKE